MSPSFERGWNPICWVSVECISLWHRSYGENALLLIILLQWTLFSTYFGLECHTMALTLARGIKERAPQWSGWSRGLNPWSGRVGSLEGRSWPIGWCLDCVGDQGFSWITSEWRGYSTVLKVASRENKCVCVCVWWVKIHMIYCLVFLQGWWPNHRRSWQQRPHSEIPQSASQEIAMETRGNTTSLFFFRYPPEHEEHDDERNMKTHLHLSLLTSIKKS